MKRILNSNYSLFAHRLLLIGVLAAMFFSSGEGISLLPFSDGQNDAELSAEQTEIKLFSYVFAVNNSVNRRVKSVKHFQPNLRNHLLNTGLFSLQIEEVIARSTILSKQIFDSPNIYSLNSVLSQPSDRAPPAV